MPATRLAAALPAHWLAIGRLLFPGRLKIRDTADAVRDERAKCRVPIVGHRCRACMERVTSPSR